MPHGVGYRARIKAHQVVHEALVRTSRIQSRIPGLAGIWQLAHGAANRWWRDTEVQTRLHGYPAIINFANPYPVAIRLYANYNAPIVELLAATAEAKQRSINVVDVGASIGDTALLLLSRGAAFVSSLHCVEGDDEFFRILTRNLPSGKTTAYHAILSDTPGPIGDLVRNESYQGTANIGGVEGRVATTVDALCDGFEVDMIKIDTDGFDGRILAGSTRILNTDRPSVLFEWHPIMCETIGTDYLQAFEVLGAAGYNRFVFFTKYGQFSHFGESHLDELRKLCLKSTTLIDWHYDVVALHASSKVDEVRLADLSYWGQSGWAERPPLTARSLFRLPG